MGTGNIYFNGPIDFFAGVFLCIGATNPYGTVTGWDNSDAADGVITDRKTGLVKDSLYIAKTIVANYLTNIKICKTSGNTGERPVVVLGK